MATHTREQLKLWQAFPLEVKIGMTQKRIREWVYRYGEDGVYISFSGGKDSTALSRLVDMTFPDNKIPRVFVNTGLEFPEIVQFVKQEPRAVIMRPEMNFKKVIEKYGYPFISKEVAQTMSEARKGYKRSYEKATGTGRFEKYGDAKQMFTCEKYAFFLREDAPRITHMCCHVMKKRPAHKYAHETGRVCMTAEMAQESQLRTSNWLQHGCNMYDNKYPKSTPMAFWTEQDVLAFLKKYDIPICSVYGDIVVKSDTIPEGQMTMFDCGMCEDVSAQLATTKMKRTGCMFCGFGCQFKDDERFLIIKELHPKIYNWIMKPLSEGGLDYKRVIDWINENGNLNIRY